MLNPNFYENSRDNGISIMEVLGEDSPSMPFVPLRETSFKGSAEGPLIKATLKQIFLFSKKQTPHVIEAAYRFPLPGDASVSGVKVTFGKTTIETELKQRDEACEEYDLAKKSGKQALLMTKETGNVFTLLISGISPDEEVTVETSYCQIASRDGIDWTLRIPLTTAPRYTRYDELDNEDSSEQPLRLAWNPGHRFSFEFTLPVNSQVQCPTNATSVEILDGHKNITLAEGPVIPDQDMILKWNNRTSLTNLDIHLYDDPGTPYQYYMAELSPPMEESIEKKPREITVLVDHSGSMEGSKWESSDWSTKQILNSLTEEDCFNLCLFESNTYWFRTEPVVGNRFNVEKAIFFLENNRESGGTDLGVALEQALLQPINNSAQMARNVLIITDAQVTDTKRILSMIRSEQQKSIKRRISTLCIDSAPNSYLAQEIARLGGGITRFLTSNPDELDITTAIDKVLETWSSPVYTGLVLQIYQKDKRLDTVDLGDLPMGISIWKTGKVTADKEEPVTFQIKDSEKDLLSIEKSPDQTDSVTLSSIKQIYGAEVISSIESLLAQNLTLDELKTRLEELGLSKEIQLSESKIKTFFYRENRQRSYEKKIKTLLVSKSLEFQLPSTQTAFMAVQETEGKKPRETIIIPNALPRGWDFLDMANIDLSSASCSYSLSKKRPAHTMCCLVMKKPEESTPSNMCASTDSYSGKKRIKLPVKIMDKKLRQITIFNSTEKTDRAKLPAKGILCGIETCYSTSIKPENIPEKGYILIYVGDPLSPAAKVSLRDMASQGNRRPLNLRISRDKYFAIELELGTGDTDSQNLPEEIILDVDR